MFLLKIQPQKTVHVSVTLKIPADSGYLFGIVLSVSDAKSEGVSAVVCTEENLDDRHREMIRKELQKFGGPSKEECPSVHFVTGARVDHSDQNVEGEWATWFVYLFRFLVQIAAYYKSTTQTALLSSTPSSTSNASGSQLF